MKKKNRLN